MKNIHFHKNILLILFFISFSTVVYTQTEPDRIAYGYDDNGNRTSRVFVAGGTLNSAYTEGSENEKEVKDELLGEHLMLHPNPTEGKIIIYINKELEENVTFYVYDMNGKMVSQARYEGFQKEIDLSGQAPGTYYLKVAVGEKVISRKIIKK